MVPVLAGRTGDSNVMGVRPFRAGGHPLAGGIGGWRIAGTVTGVDGQQPAKPASKGSLALLVVFVVAVVFVCVTAFISRSGDDSDPDPGPDAERVCQDFVKKRLKAPATAKFSDVNHSGGVDGEYTVTGAVDSQNSFGALIRSDFTCTVKDDGDQWRLVTINVG